ncbi:hypothetical protein [Spirosoma sp.]|uniref:hypothetical protein n=1 Tax=Spirosoma sp. TaxID=1899569 RepID=UPI003B3AE178
MPKNNTGNKNLQKAPSSPKMGFGEKIILHIKSNIYNILGVVGVLFTIITYTSNEKTYGILSSCNKARVPFISFGWNRFRIETKNGALFVDEGKPILGVILKDGKLFVNAILRNKDGVLLAEIKNNEWSFTNPGMGLQKNYNDNAIEVKDFYGNVILQIMYLGDTVHIAGVFYCRAGQALIISIDEEGAASFDKLKKGELDYKKLSKIIPIFTYPAVAHQGECPGCESLEKLISEREVNDSTGYLVRESPIEICNIQSFKDVQVK